MKKHATISADGRYRYWLERSWDETGKGFVNFIMLNPSTADAEHDDPTIRRCINFAKAWGYDGMHVVNLFALRATDPACLYKHPDPIGPDNNTFLEAGFMSAELSIAAWGGHGKHMGRAISVFNMARSMNARLCCLRMNGDGSPSHPLYLPSSCTPQPIAMQA